MAPVTPVSSGLIAYFENGARPAWPSNTAGVVTSAVFRTNSRRLLTYKRMQPAKIGAIWCVKYFPGTSGSCATAVKEVEEEDDETWEMSLSIRVGTFAVRLKLVMCTVQSLLRHGKLSLPVFSPIQE